MAEDKNYLNELMDMLNENHRKRNEETDSLSDSIPGENKPFTKKIMQQNPGIPQDDIQDYVQNVKDDHGDYLMGGAMGSPALKVGSALEGLAAKLPVVSRFRGLIDNPVVQKIREPFKQQRNMDMLNATNKEMSDIVKRGVKEVEAPQIDALTNQRNYKNWLKDKAATESELAYHNNQAPLQDAIQKNNAIKLDPKLDQTAPGIPQELIDAILSRKAK